MWICKTKSPKLGKFCLGFLFLGLITTQAIYGYGFAFHNNNIILVSENLPWSRPIHFNKILIKLGIVSREGVYSFKKPDAQGQMNYPLTELNCIGGERYNIVFLVVDSLRYDMIKPRDHAKRLQFFSRRNQLQGSLFRWYQYKTWNFYSFYRKFQAPIGKDQNLQNRDQL